MYEWPPSGYFCEGEIFEVSVPLIMDDLSEFNEHSDDGTYGDVETVRDTYDEDETTREVCVTGMQDAGTQLHDKMHAIDELGVDSGEISCTTSAAKQIYMGYDHIQDAAFLHTHAASTGTQDKDGQISASYDSHVDQAQILEAPKTDNDAIADLFPWLKDSITTDTPAHAAAIAQGVGSPQTETVVVEQLKQTPTCASSETGADSHVSSIGVGQAYAASKKDMHGLLDNDHLTNCSAPEGVPIHGTYASDIIVGKQYAQDQPHREAARAEPDAAMLQPWMNVWGDDVFEPSDRPKETRQQDDVDGAKSHIRMSESESDAPKSDPQDPDLLKAMQLSLSLTHGRESGTNDETIVSRDSQVADLL